MSYRIQIIRLGQNVEKVGKVHSFAGGVPFVTGVALLVLSTKHFALPLHTQYQAPGATLKALFTQPSSSARRAGYVGGSPAPAMTLANSATPTVTHSFQI